MAIGAMPAQAALLATLWLLICVPQADGPERDGLASPSDIFSESGLWCEERAEDGERQLPAASHGVAEKAWPPDRAGSRRESAWAEPTARRVLRVTAYCDRGTTAAGVPSGVGQCAAPADIPFGSVIYIPQLQRSFVVTDRTARRFRHNTVDLFIPSHERCRQFGRKYLECRIRTPDAPVEYGAQALFAQVRMRT